MPAAASSRYAGDLTATREFPGIGYRSVLNRGYGDYPDANDRKRGPVNEASAGRRSRQWTPDTQGPVGGWFVSDAG